MKCECGEEMGNAIGCWDLPIDYVAFNVYLCDTCGTICKQTVGKDLLWVKADNSMCTEKLPATTPPSADDEHLAALASFVLADGRLEAARKRLTAAHMAMARRPGTHTATGVELDAIARRHGIQRKPAHRAADLETDDELRQRIVEARKALAAIVIAL